MFAADKAVGERGRGRGAAAAHTRPMNNPRRTLLFAATLRIRPRGGGRG